MHPWTLAVQQTELLNQQPSFAPFLKKIATHIGHGYLLQTVRQAFEIQRNGGEVTKNGLHYHTPAGLISVIVKRGLSKAEYRKIKKTVKKFEPPQKVHLGRSSPPVTVSSNSSGNDLLMTVTPEGYHLQEQPARREAQIHFN